jgi:hypothetical protein
MTLAKVPVEHSSLHLHLLPQATPLLPDEHDFEFHSSLPGVPLLPPPPLPAPPAAQQWQQQLLRLRHPFLSLTVHYLPLLQQWLLPLLPQFPLQPHVLS